MTFFDDLAKEYIFLIVDIIVFVPFCRSAFNHLNLIVSYIKAVSSMRSLIEIRTYLSKFIDHKSKQRVMILALID